MIVTAEAQEKLILEHTSGMSDKEHQAFIKGMEETFKLVDKLLTQSKNYYAD